MSGSEAKSRPDLYSCDCCRRTGRPVRIITVRLECRDDHLRDGQLWLVWCDECAVSRGVPVAASVGQAWAPRTDRPSEQRVYCDICGNEYVSGGYIGPNGLGNFCSAERARKSMSQGRPVQNPDILPHGAVEVGSPPGAPTWARVGKVHRCTACGHDHEMVLYRLSLSTTDYWGMCPERMKAAKVGHESYRDAAGGLRLRLIGLRPMAWWRRLRG